MRLIFICIFLCSVPVRFQSQSTDRKPMNNAEFKILLGQIEDLLPVFENELNGIDLDKNPQITYSTGKRITDKKAIALMEIGNIRVSVAKLKAKRTVYDELALKEFLDSLFADSGDIVWEEDLSHLSLTHLEKRAPELSLIIMRVSNDVFARVRLLETGPCRKL